MQDPHTREMWHMYLDSYNCHTVVSKNGVEALNTATTISVEVALIDVNIKDIEYMEILKVLRDRKPQPIIFLVKGMLTRRANQEEGNLGIWGVLDKSISDKLLAGEIMQAIKDKAGNGA